MVEYLRAHRDEVYPYLDELGERARIGLRRRLGGEAWGREGLRVEVFGVGSLVAPVVVREEPTRPMRNAVDLSDAGHAEANRLLHLALLNEGVHSIRVKAAFSTAHTVADVDVVVAAAERAVMSVAAEDAGSGRTRSGGRA